jgi:hypothetical protein
MEDGDPYFLFKQSRTLNIFYFIGRLNPPHPGHIHALTQMIETANAHNSVALILLGSGPKGERTLENPVPFETKEEFLKFILPPHLQYTIRRLTNPSADVTQWYENVLSHIEYPSQVEFVRFAGDKGDNATKFLSLDDYFRSLHVRSKSTTVAIPPVMSASTEMSATIVRRDAYTAYVNGKDQGRDGYPLFRDQYYDFYDNFCEQMYREIVEPATNLSREEIIAYIQDKTMPKKSKGKSKSKTKKSNRANGGINNENEHSSGKGKGKGKGKSKSKGKTQKNMENSD